jgi:hypothetical protein
MTALIDDGSRALVDTNVVVSPQRPIRPAYHGDLIGDDQFSGQAWNSRHKFRPRTIPGPG